MSHDIINYILQCNAEKYPLVCIAKVIIDNSCLTQSMQHIDVEEKHKAQRWLWGKRGDDYPTPCLSVNHFYCYQYLVLALLKSL